MLRHFPGLGCPQPLLFACNIGASFVVDDVYLCSHFWRRGSCYFPTGKLQASTTVRGWWRAGNDEQVAKEATAIDRMVNRNPRGDDWMRRIFLAATAAGFNFQTSAQAANLALGYPGCSFKGPTWAQETRSRAQCAVVAMNVEGSGSGGSVHEPQATQEKNAEDVWRHGSPEHKPRIAAVMLQASAAPAAIISRLCRPCLSRAVPRRAIHRPANEPTLELRDMSTRSLRSRHPSKHTRRMLRRPHASGQKLHASIER